MNGDLSQVWEEELWVHPASCPEPFEYSSSPSVSLISVFHLHVPALQYTHEFGSNFIELRTTCYLIDHIRKRHKGLSVRPCSFFLKLGFTKLHLAPNSISDVVVSSTGRLAV